MKGLLSWVIRMFHSARTGLAHAWRWFRGRKLWQQGAMAAALLVVIIGGVVLARSGNNAQAEDQTRTVVVESVSALNGGGDSVSVVGTVRSVTEADLLAEAGGAVEAVHTRIGASVPAGFVIAELQNDTERAQVLQAQGAYDAAVAAGAAVSPVDADTDARNTYRTTVSTIDSVLHTDVDLFFGNPTPFGPQFVLEAANATIPQQRAALESTITSREANIGSASTRPATDLLDEANADLTKVNTLLDAIAAKSNEHGSGATTAQQAALAAARASINAQLSAVSAARAAYRSKSTGSTASVNANIKSALGTLRLAQANLEKTIIRAPIGGTVNFLPIRVGDYVTNLEHVATVAQNGALEIVTYVSEDTRTNITPGMKVRIDDKYDGVITSIAPALDPVTKQIEVHVAVNGKTELVDGQSVRISFASATAPKPTATVSAGPILLPLTAVKLTADSRVVFTVDANNMLVAHNVQIGDVRGDRIEVVNGATPDMQIVTDARGLSTGQKVKVSTNPQATI